MRRLLAELLALPLLPLLVVQGRRTRRITPRLPEAAGPCTGVAASSDSVSDAPPLSLLAIGESPVAGVGVAGHEQAITCRFAHALAARTRRPVRWRACGKNGITAGEAVHILLPQVPAQPVDIVMVAFGVNDTTAFRSNARWRTDLLTLCETLRSRCSPRVLVICGVPPVGRFPALPEPLRMVLGLKAEALDATARAVAAQLPHTLHVPVVLDPLEASLMASDGYHPSEAGCSAWAEALAQACAAHVRVMT